MRQKEQLNDQPSDITKNIYLFLCFFPIIFFILFFYVKISFFPIYINYLYIFDYSSIVSALLIFLNILCLLYGIYVFKKNYFSNSILILFLIFQFVMKILESTFFPPEHLIIQLSNYSFFVFTIIICVQFFGIYRQQDDSFSPFALLIMYIIPYMIMLGHSSLLSGITSEWFELRQMPIRYFPFEAEVQLAQLICFVGLLIFSVQLVCEQNNEHRLSLSNIKLFSNGIAFIGLLAIHSILALHLYPYNQQAIGRFLATCNIHQFAIKAFQYSLNVQPLNDKTHKMIGTSLVSQGQFEKGLNHFLKAIELNPIDSKIYINAGLVSIKQQNLSKAKQYFSYAVWMNPKSSSAHHYLGFIHSLFDQHELAISQFRESLRLNPDDENVHFHMALLLSKQKKWQQALGHFKEAIWINPDFIDAYIHLGNLFIQLGAIENAFETFKKALHLKPNDPTISQQLNTITQMSFDFAKQLTAKNKFEQAITVYQRILKYRPDYSVSIHYNIACTYARNNQVKQAIEWLKKSVMMGFKDWQFLKKDSDFDSIRQHAMFIDFIHSAAGS